MFISSDLVLGLVTRCLFRLHYLAEKKPFDAATFAFIFPLLKHVLLRGASTSTDEDEGDDESEDGELTMQILGFHCASCQFDFSSLMTTVD